MKKIIPGWALITGASGGIGKEFCKILASQGWNLILVSRTKSQLEALAAELASEHGIKTNVQIADLSVPRAGEALHAACVKSGLTIDLLINNAGWGIFGECADLPPADVEGMLNLNINALTVLCGLFGAQMRARGHGMILNVGSFAGNQAAPYLASYGASKSYVLQFSLALRAELKSHGVTVTCLQPGYVETGFDAHARIKHQKYLDFSKKNSMPAPAVAQVGLKSVFSGKSHVIAGASNKAANLFFKCIPIAQRPMMMKSIMDNMITKG